MEKPNRRGRPTLDDEGQPSMQVAVRLAQKDYDDLCRRATQDRMTIAELIRRDLRRGKPDPLA